MTAASIVPKSSLRMSLQTISAVGFGRQQFDAAHPATVVGGEQQGGQQSLAAAQVQHAGAARHHLRQQAIGGDVVHAALPPVVVPVASFSASMRSK